MSASIHTRQQYFKGLGAVAIVVAFSASARASEHALTYVGTHITQNDRQAILGSGPIDVSVAI